MKLSTREDVEAPIEVVFDALCQFDSFELQALQRGIDVRRLDDLVEPGPGMIWRAHFEMRRQKRSLTLETVRLVQPTEIQVDLDSASLGGSFAVELIELARQRTRMMVSLDLRPRTFAARLVVQSMRLGKSRLTTRFKSRVAEQAREIEARSRIQ